MAVGLLEDDGLPRHVVAHAAVGGVALDDAGQRREAHGRRADLVWQVRRRVEQRVVAVGPVDFRDRLGLPAVGQVVDEGAQDPGLALLALGVFRLGVSGAGVEEQIGEDVVAGLDGLVAHAVVVVEPLHNHGQRRQWEGSQDHGAHFLRVVVGPRLDTDVFREGRHDLWMSLAVGPVYQDVCD